MNGFIARSRKPQARGARYERVADRGMLLGAAVAADPHRSHESSERPFDGVVADRFPAYSPMVEVASAQSGCALAQGLSDLRRGGAWSSMVWLKMVGGKIGEHGPFYRFTRPALTLDNILKGAKPGDLPIQQPIKFEMVANMKTAKADRRHVHANVHVAGRSRDRMKRRSLLAFAAMLPASGTAWPQPARKRYRLGLLRFTSAIDAATNPSDVGFREGMRARGYVEDRDYVIETLVADGKAERLPALAQDLVRAKVDLILADSTVVAAAARRATGKIPIVMRATADPVRTGLVDSLRRPGGNVTGLTFQSPDLVGKRLELLKEALPGLRSVAAFHNLPGVERLVRESEAAAKVLGLAFEAVEAGTDPGGWDGDFARVRARGVEAVMAIESPVYNQYRAEFAQAALRHRMPTVAFQGLMAKAGALMSYGADIVDLHRRAATYVDKILKGANPADLPIEQPIKFDLVVNLSTAKALRLTIPYSILLRASEVIE